MAILIGTNEMSFRDHTSSSLSSRQHTATVALTASVGALALAAEVLFLPIDLGMLVLTVGAFIDGLVILAVAISKNRRRRLGILSILVILLIASAVAAANYQAIRERARWMLLSDKYKNQVMEAGVYDGPLRFIEWDGWGFAGEDTVVYLVFDPSDSLEVGQNGDHKKLLVSNCEVSNIRRFARNWYSVKFYTDTSWGPCE